MPTCRKLFLSWVRFAISFARASAGSNIAARMAMIAITTSNSINVNADAPACASDLLLLGAVRAPLRRANPTRKRDFIVVEIFKDFGEGGAAEDLLELAAHGIFARFLVEQCGDAFAEFVAGPAQVSFQDLADVHAAGNAERVEHDFDRRAVGEIGHVFIGKNARNHALVAVTAGHLIAHAQLALHGDINLHQLDDAGRKLIALLQLVHFLFDDLAQDVNLARGHLFDFINLLVHARVLVRKLNALQVARGNAVDGFAIELRALGEQSLVGLLVVQVSFDLLASQNAFKALEALVGENADFISEVLLEALDLRSFDVLGSLVFFLAFAGEDFHVHDRAFDSRRAGEGSIAHVAGFFAEDGAQQFLFRRELRLALGRDFAHQNVAGLDGGANADDTAFIEVAQRMLAHVGNIARDFFGSQLGVAGFDFKLFDVDRSVVIVLHQLFGNQDGVLKVVTAPGHEGDEYVAAKRQLAVIGTRAIGDDLAFDHAIAAADDRLLIDGSVLG